MKWKFCEDCRLDGHCQNQDMGHKCECYGKKLEDKLVIAKYWLKEIATAYRQTPITMAEKALKKIEELDK